MTWHRVYGKLFNIKVNKNYPKDSETEHTSKIIFYKKWKVLDNIFLTLLIKV